MIRFFALVGLASCGAGVSQHPELDVRCNPTDEFAAPKLVRGLDDGGGVVSYVRFSPDELTAYFSILDARGNGDIYTSRRPSVTATFGPFVALSALESAVDDLSPTVTADGSTLYMDSNRSGAYQVLTASWLPADGAFSAPVPIPILDVSSEGGAYVLPDGSALYFQSARDTGTESSLFRAARTENGFETPMPLSVNTSNAERNAVISPDEKVLYFATNWRNPSLGDGVTDIWMATRASAADNFGEPVFLDALNTPSQELPSWVSPDGCRLYFTRLDSDLRPWVYVAERPR